MKDGKKDKLRQTYEFYEEFASAFGLFKKRKNKVDFIINDMVRCTYIEGLFKVVAVEPYYLVICPLDDRKTLHYVGYHFLEKVSHNQKFMKVLFHD